MYYLNSRYYNPEWGRFINADALVGQTGDLLGHNKFTYCLNNPINMLDPSGYKANWLRIGRGLLTMAVGSLAVLAGAAASETGIGVVGAVLGANTILSGFDDLMSGIQGYSDKEMPTCNPAAAVVGMASWGVGYVQHAITRSTYTAEEQADYYDYGEVAFNLLDLGLAVRGIYNLSMSVTKSLILHLDDVAGAPSDIKTIGQGYTIRKNNNSKVWQFSDIDFE